jgi:hypothetical protein
MASKIATFLITLIVNIAIGVAVFLFMLLAMNGYSESDASYGLVTFAVLALLAGLLMSTGSAFVAHVLLRRQFRGWVAAAIAIPVFSIIGAGLIIVCGMIGVATAEYVRVNY